MSSLLHFCMFPHTNPLIQPLNGVFNQPNKGLSIEWLQDGKALGKTKSQTLVKTAEDLKKHTFSCKVSNSYTSLISEPVQHNCTKPGEY